MNQFRCKIILYVEEHNPKKFQDGIEIYTSNSVLKQKNVSIWKWWVFLQSIETGNVKLNNSFENFLLLGYFNVTPEKKNINDFFNTFCLNI